MTQNTSSAVMQQRSEPHDSLDDFPTQPWATRALIEHVLRPHGHATNTQRCWEPACNRGHMVRPLREYFGRVIASDIFDYGFLGQDARNLDFLLPYSDGIFAMRGGVDWIITNPPFRLAEQFIHRAFSIASQGVAVIVRTSFLEGVGRYEGLFSRNPPSIVAQFTERVPMVKGRLTATGSTATSYCWLVWMQGEDDNRMMWIPPCRRQLERPGDYSA
jgi:hypothetical protein